MREIVLDTETTGLSHKDGHRIVEIGCVELHNHIPTGNIFHAYINPERDVPPSSTAVTGLTGDFLKKHPPFRDMFKDFLDFLKEDLLIIHNAPFDRGFLNAELERLKYPHFPRERVKDTLSLARQKFPGAPASLDALCKRFKIDLSGRERHGALLDARLLADVYVELLGGRQRVFELTAERTSAEPSHKIIRADFPKRNFPISELEEIEHKNFLKTLKKNALWCQG